MIMTIRTLLACCTVSALTAIACATSSAEPPQFRISQVYSNLDGSIQFVELTEMAGLNGQHRFAGMTLSVTRDGIKKQYTFPYDLSTEQTANLSIVVAATARLPVGSYGGYSYFCCYEPTFGSLPTRFLPTGSATLDFAGVDQVAYAGLPTDGENALYRDGTVQVATVGGRPCQPVLGCGRFAIDHAYSYIWATEYYNAALDHYFVAALADEIDDIDAGRRFGWQRTGERFVIGGGFDTYPGLDHPVCRFYLPPGTGDSHFYSASVEECAEVKARFPALMLETTAAFHAALPDSNTGACPTDLDFNGGGLLDPLYRLWNGRMDSNHRYTKSTAIRDDMIRRGYVSEGYGPMGVAMCVR
jgi:hypothetical protein